MRTIRISDDVWTEIAKHGRFGETEDDALRRAFSIRPKDPGLDASQPPPSKAKPGNALRHHWNGSRLTLRFDGGQEEKTVELPWDKSDKRTIRRALEECLEFGNRNSASEGQLMAIRKIFTGAGYHLTR